MRVTEIHGEAGLRDLRPAWENLLRQSDSNTIFLTWEWAAAWWSAYGNEGELRVLAAFDEHGVLRGIAPLRCRIVRKYGQAVPALAFLGDGSNDSEYLDFITAKGYEQPVVEAFLRHSDKELHDGGVLLLNEIPETSVNLPYLKKLAAARGMFSIEAQTPCAVVHLPETWEDYLTLLRPRFRTKIRSVLRNLEGRAGVRMGFCQTEKEVRQTLPVLFDLHARRWAQDGKPGVFGWDRKRRFYFAVSPLLLERGWLRFSWLEWNGQLLACQYGFVYDGRYFHLQEGYELASEHWNVGVGLRALSIRKLLEEGVREYDFLGGVGRHKSDWGAETKFSRNILLARASHRNLLVRRGADWECRARTSIAQACPERILAARRQRLQARSLSAYATQNGFAAESPARQWLLRAAAGCYFHLGLPKLIRPVRERYELSISPSRRSRPIEWQRRREATARILYYHRVNDDHDPFFPAMATSVFERQMRYLARHYKVLPLGQIFDHLSSGSPEPVLAITFDDGYQDNFQNALPILRRYGLPATIYLTTGSIDCREPLWFERLALAFEKTPREFIDLELDLPRRFWLRTTAERLQSNDRIFGLLRNLPDIERRQLLEDILRQLNAIHDGKRDNKMLTWDQVRQMKAHRIDFGGHTVSHPFLSQLDREQAAREVTECKRRIEEELQCPVEHFAYPNGREQDFTQGSKDLLQEAGYRTAVTTVWGPNFRSSDPLELKRGGPWEESSAVFAYKLDWYQLVNG